jgi:uncharacterized protein
MKSRDAPRIAVGNSGCVPWIFLPYGNIVCLMAVNPELLKILVCPLCKAPVNLTESGQGLKCSQCRRVYPIRDDIPVMLISEAKVED